MMLGLLDERSTQPPKYFGKYPGIVVATAASDKDTKARLAVGEVTVQVPGIPQETADDQGTRPLEGLAMPCFPPGCFFVPEVGDRVWVEFIAGDISHMLWTGVWYPFDKAPKTHADAAPTPAQRVLRTGGGVTVVVDDTANAQAITLKRGEQLVELTAKALTLTCGESVLELTAETMSLTAGGHTVELSKDGLTYNGTPFALLPAAKTLLALIKSHNHMHGPTGPSTTGLDAPTMTKPPILMGPGKDWSTEGGTP